MSASRTLVLGASGQLGAELCRQLGAEALPAARRPSSADWLRLDLEELSRDASGLPALLDTHNVHAVICSAGATDVERCESEPGWAEAANHTGPLAMALAAAGRPFVFFSTDYVFDGRKTATDPAGPYNEDAETHPLSVYGRSKLAGERDILNAHSRALVIRTTTVYGPDPQGKNFLYTLRRLLSAGQTMRVPSDQFATPTHNTDLASVTLALLRAGHSGLFHATGPEFLARTAFAYQACRILALDGSLIQPVTTAELQQRAARPLFGGLCCDRLASVLGAGLLRAPEDGIADWAATLPGSSAGAVA